MSTQLIGQQLEDGLAAFPSTILSPEGRNVLVSAFRQLDSLGRMDQRTGEKFVDEMSLRRTLGTHLPEEIVNQYVERAKAHLGGRMLDAATAQSKSLVPITYLNLLDRHLPAVDATFDPGRWTSENDIKAAIKKRYPDFPEEWFTPGTLYHHFRQAITDMATNTSTAMKTNAELISASSTWDIVMCVVNNLGWWIILDATAVFLIVAAITAFSAGTLTAPALAGISFVTGVSIITTWYVIATCISNPGWQGGPGY
jgi:hypothetical protein